MKFERKLRTNKMEA